MITYKLMKPRKNGTLGSLFMEAMGYRIDELKLG